MIPRLQGSRDDGALDLKAYTTKRGIAVARGKNIPLAYPFTEETCWLLGLYVAEGCSSPNGVKFSLNKEETTLALKIKTIACSLGYSTCETKAETALVVEIPSRILARAFPDICGKGTAHKRIPEVLLLHKNIALLASLLDGYFDGDGSVAKNAITAVTVSNVLALQLQLALARFGKFACIRKDITKENQTIQGRIVKCKPRYHIYSTNTFRWKRGRRHIVQKNHILVPVRSIKTTHYRGQVYNISTNDETYLVSNAIVHNCGLVHGGFKSMRDAHAKRLCDTCNLDAINAIKDQVQDVIHDPDHKPKSMAKIVGNEEQSFAEALDPLDPFDPFDEPMAEPDKNIPPAPEDDLDVPTDIKADIERLLLGNWVDVARYEFCHEQDHDFAEIEIDERWGPGNYDKDDPGSTTKFKLDVGRDEEWIFFKDSDEAESYALDIVRTNLRDEPEIFSQNWLKDFVDEDKLRREIGDPYEDWEDEVRGLDYEDLLSKMVDENYVEFDDPIFFKKNQEPRPETPARVIALNVYLEDYVDKEKPTFEPWDYLEEIYGKDETIKKAIEMVGINIDEAAKAAISADGWEHFVARYDGNSHDLESGAVYCRVN